MRISDWSSDVCSSDLFGSLGDLLANYIRLKNIGILPYWCINHGPTTSLYYRDLDGNQIETQVGNFDTPEKLTAFFKSEAFQENPRGEIGRASSRERECRSVYISGVAGPEKKKHIELAQSDGV